MSQKLSSAAVVICSLRVNVMVICVQRQANVNRQCYWMASTFVCTNGVCVGVNDISNEKVCLKTRSGNVKI